MVVVFAIVHHIPPIETMQMSSVVAAAARAGCDRIIRLHFCVLKYVEGVRDIVLRHVAHSRVVYCIFWYHALLTEPKGSWHQLPKFADLSSLWLQ